MIENVQILRQIVKIVKQIQKMSFISEIIASLNWLSEIIFFKKRILVIGSQFVKKQL